MTPSEIEEVARNKYNAIGDSFWSQAEIFDLITEACNEAALEGLMIQRTYTTTTVSGTQEYDFPTNVMALKRVTYNGQKLKPITMREDDAVTGLNQGTTSTGTPQYYYTWNYTVSLRPIPDGAYTLKLWTYNEPSAISVTSTLEIPTMFHMRLVNFILAEMAAKDQNAKVAMYYAQRWEKSKIEMKKWAAKRKRTDSFGEVQDEDQMVASYLGFV